MAPPAEAAANLKLDKKGMMDGIDNDDDDDEDDEDSLDKKGYGTGAPVPDVNYSGSSKKVKIKKEKQWGATSSTATSDPSNQHYPPATINVAETSRQLLAANSRHQFQD